MGPDELPREQVSVPPHQPQEAAAVQLSQDVWDEQLSGEAADGGVGGGQSGRTGGEANAHARHDDLVHAQSMDGHEEEYGP